MALSLLRGAMEIVTLVLISASPWVYGAVHPGFEFLLLAGVGVLLLLWGARMVLEGHISWKKSPLALCLAGLFLLGVWQIVPLSRTALGGISPATARLYDRLLPSRMEVFPDADEKDPSPAAGETISLYPAETRKQLVRLLAIFLVFAVVRNNIASTAALWRLAVVAVVNGACLSLFALVQFFSSPPDTLYWTYPSLGQVFGPFICRNHFPFYINLCIGLGFGLLLNRGRRSSGGILHDPTTMWVCASLTLMLGAVAVCLSRGGFLALTAGFLVCLLLKRYRSTRSFQGGAALLVLALAVVLTSWLGFGLVTERLATLWKGEALQSRLPLWSRIAPTVKDFPVWGTGFGAFEYFEPLSRTSAEESGYRWQHAHNEYLEILVEGGLVGLVFGVLAVVLVFRSGYRAICRGADGAGGLALGALLAFTTLAIHSFGDFGIHIPAITLLATVLAAHLCALGDEAGTSANSNADSGEYRLRLGGLAPWLGAATCVALAMTLGGTGWRAHQVDRLEAAVLASSDRLEGQIAYLEEATRIAPDDANLQAQLGQTRTLLLKRETGLREVKSLAAVVAEALPASRGDWGAALGWCIQGMAERERARREQQRFVDRRLLPILRNYRNARNCCPILSGPHLILATYGKQLQRADSADAYLERVKLLAGGEPDLWYLCGVEELLANKLDSAWASWRRSLELSDRHLLPILETSTRFLSREQQVDAVMPDQPTLLLTAGFRLSTERGAEEGRPFFHKALLLLEQHTRGARPEELHVKARAQKALGRTDEALMSYRQLLSQQPGHAGWRYERAQLLQEQGRLEESRRELVVILAQEPRQAGARELLALVTRELARQR